MFPRKTTVGPLVAGNASLLVGSVTPVSGTPLTLLTTALDVPRRIFLAYGNEGAPRTLALVGTDRAGNAIKETLSVPAGGAGSPINTTQDFLTLTSATPAGGGWSANMTLGTGGIASGPWIVMNSQVSPSNIGIAVVVSGTVNYTVEYTYDNLNALTLSGSQGFSSIIQPTVWSFSALASKTASTDLVNVPWIEPIWAMRLTLNSFTNPGSATATFIQAGVSQGGHF